MDIEGKETEELAERGFLILGQPITSLDESMYVQNGIKASDKVRVAKTNKKDLRRKEVEVATER